MTRAEVRLAIPQRLTDAIIFMRGESDGRRWLAALPRRVAAYSRQWNLRPIAIADGGAMSCCVFCETGDDRPAVLKIPVDEASGRLEARALDHWSTGDASPAVFRRSRRTGVFLMQRIVPGDTPVPANGPLDSQHFAHLVERLLKAGEPARRFVDVSTVAGMRLDWAVERFRDKRYAADITPIATARKVLAELCATTSTVVALHGDLQPKNILAGQRGHWYAIDPFPCSGDINSDAALWAVMQDSPTSIAERINELAVGPHFDSDRMRRWAFVFATAELRPYLTATARRMQEFLDSQPLVRGSC